MVAGGVPAVVPGVLPEVLLAVEAGVPGVPGVLPGVEELSAVVLELGKMKEDEGTGLTLVVSDVLVPGAVDEAGAGDVEVDTISPEVVPWEGTEEAGLDEAVLKVVEVVVAGTLLADVVEVVEVVVVLGGTVLEAVLQSKETVGTTMLQLGLGLLG